MTFRGRVHVAVSIAVVLLIAGAAIAIWRARRPAVSSRDIHGRATPAAQSPAASSARTADRPELVLQAGHLDGVSSLAFSPDGRLLASYGQDGTVKLWDAGNGRELRSLTAGSLDPQVRFSRDGQSVVLVDGFRLLEWSVLTGRSVSVDERALDRTADGQWIAGTDEESFVIWNAATGIKSRVAGKTPGMTPAARFSPDGRWLALQEQPSSAANLSDFRNVQNLIAADSVEITTTILEVATWRPMLTTRGRRPMLSPVVFSPDGRLLAVIADGRKAIDVWDIRAARQLGTRTSPAALSVAAFSPDSRLLAASSDSYVRMVQGLRKDSRGGDTAARAIVVWDMTNDAPPRAFDAPAGVSSFAFSPDSRVLASAGDDGVVYRDLSNAEAQPVRVDEGTCNAVAFSADGRRIAWGRQTDVKVRDFPGDQPPTVLTASVEPAGALALSPDGRWLATARDPGLKDEATPVRLWDLAGGRGARVLDAPPRAVRTLAFSPDSQKILAVGDSVAEWDAATGQRVSGAGSEAASARPTFSADGRRIIVGPDPAGNLLVVDVGSGVRPRTVKVGFDEDQLMLSPDGRWLATGRTPMPPDFANGALSVWDLSTLTKIRTWNENSFNPTVSPDGRYLAASGGAGRPSLKLWDVASGNELLAVGMHFGADAGVVDAIAFSPDSRLLAFSNSTHGIEIWDVAARAQVATLTGHTGSIGEIRFDAQGRRLISRSTDGTIRAWSVPGGELLITLVLLRDAGQWLAVTPDGLFDGSPDAWNRILWRFSENTFDVAPVETFFNEFYSPGVLADAFTGQRPAAPRDIALLDRRQPAIRLSTKDGAGSERQVPLRIEVDEARADAGHPSGSGARDLRLFRNGSLVKAWRGDVVASGAGRATLEATVPIIAGTNRFTAYAFNRDNVKSEDGVLTVTGAQSLQRAGIAYVLAIGVNQYANGSFNLKYAVADATRFAEEYAAQQRRTGRFRDVKVWPLLDRDATRGRVLDAVKQLAGAAQPEDVVVLFFAGHGVTDGARFYVVPHDLGYAGSRGALNGDGLRTIAEHSLSDQDLERALEGVDAAQLLLVIDACHSGQALESAEKRQGPMNSKGLAQLAYEKGMYVLTAAQSYQAALETERLGHGFLTYALIEAGLVSGRADDAPADGTILLREWLDFAAAEVPRLQIDALRNARGFKVAFVAGEESLAPEKRSVQRPRVFYRREIESQPLVVARVGAARK